MEYLLSPLTQTSNYIYLSGIFTITLGATIGITPPESRKSLYTNLAIPLFIFIGLTHIIYSFEQLTNNLDYTWLANIFQSITILCAIELSRRNLNKKYNKIVFNKIYYIPIIIILCALYIINNIYCSFTTNLITFITKILAILILINSSKKLPKTNRKILKSCFYIAFIGSIIHLFLDYYFSQYNFGISQLTFHTLPYLFYSGMALELALTILILFRRYKYELNNKVHTPNTLVLISPALVLATSIIISFGVLIGINYLATIEVISRNNYATTQLWMLIITLLIICILYAIQYGISYNNESLKNVESAQNSFQFIFNFAPNPICVIDAETTEILAANKSMEKCFEYKEPMTGMFLENMIAPNTKLKFNISDNLDAVISECQLKKANNEYFFAEITASFMEYNNKEAMLLALHDISLFKTIEEKLTEAKNIAEEANNAKSRFFANASHELRTPMTAIIGLSELAVSICHNENQKHIINLLRISSKSLMSLINDIFGLAEIQSGKLTITNSPFNLKTLLEEIIEYTNFRANQENKKVSYKLSNYLPHRVNADQDHIRQILLSTICYSTKISDKNLTINVNFEDKPNENSKLVILISGINKEKQEEISRGLANDFDFSNPYKASITRKFASGLSLQYMIIKQMNGSMSIDENSSIPDTITLKLAIEVEAIDTETAIDQNLTKDCILYSNGKQLKFLIADDNDVNLFLAQSVIKRFKGICECVKDGVEVLKALSEQNFDAILLDIQMPEMDGMQVIKEIRNMNTSFANIPIIAISAFSSSEEKNKVLEAGAQSYLSKPYFPKDLQKAISSIFDLDKELPASAKAEELKAVIEASLPKVNIEEAKENYSKEEKDFAEKLKRIDYPDFKIRISPNQSNIKQLIEIYNRRSSTLDIEIDNSINNNDSQKLREVAHSIKGLVGMMSAKESWEIAKKIETYAKEGNMESAISLIGELRIHLTEISDDLNTIKSII